MAPKYNKVSSGRKCQLTGQKANNAMTISFSHRRTKKLQHVNLQQKKVYWSEVHHPHVDCLGRQSVSRTLFQND